MTQGRFLAVGLLLIALATVPDLLVVPAIGPINLLFSIFISAIYALSAWILKKRAKWLSLTLAILSGAIQFFTPIPYWVCADTGYSFCPSTFRAAIKMATFNVADTLIILLFITGYSLVVLGIRAGLRSAREDNYI